MPGRKSHEPARPGIRQGYLEAGLGSYFWFYDEERPHQSLDYRTPGEVYRAGLRGEKP